MSYPLSDKLLALQQKTGYTIVQENGQRKMSPKFWKGPPPPKGCEIFVGKIPRNMYEDELFPVFQTAGVIYEFRLMMDFGLTNRGFAFVTYATKAEARRAIALLDGYEIRPNRILGVLKSVDNCRLSIDGIPKDRSKEEIYVEIAKHTSGVTGVIIYSTDFSKIKNLGFAIIEYESHRAASLARKVLIPGNVNMFGREVNVEWCAPPLTQPETDGENMKSVSVLLIRNILPSIENDNLLYVFSWKCTLSLQWLVRIKDFAIAHYISRDDAELIQSKLDGFNVSGSSVEVTWAKASKIVIPMQNLEKKNAIFNPKFYNSNLIVPSAKQNELPGKVMPGNSPPKILSEICQMNGWGEPVFHVVLISSTPDDTDATYTSRVYIPNLPYPVKLFVNSGIFFSAADAKNFAADFALKSIASMQSGPKIPDTIMPTSQLNSLFPEISDAAPKTSIWDDAGLPNFLTNGISTTKNEFTDQNEFLNILSSAASLANIQIQSKMAPDPPFHFQPE